MRVGTVLVRVVVYSHLLAYKASTLASLPSFFFFGYKMGIFFVDMGWDLTAPDCIDR